MKFYFDQSSGQFVLVEFNPSTGAEVIDADFSFKELLQRHGCLDKNDDLEFDSLSEEDIYSEFDD